MYIKSMRLQRFRQFSDTTIELGPFNVLVGPNNCGKTSILHAIRAFFLLMNGHVSFAGSAATYHRRYLSSAEEIAPTPDIRELWYQQAAGKTLMISVTFEDGTTFSVIIRQQFGQIHVSADDLPPKLTEKKAQGYLATQVAFIPGLVGVLVSEPYATGARRNALATQGRYSEIFRSSLLQLKESDAALVSKINEWLKDLFGVTVTTVEFNPKADEFVTVKYSQDGVKFDVVSSGAGLQQVIQMLTYLYLSQPRILLIDEPDAHLHCKLQARLGELFRRVSSDLGAQVFLSTHSIDLIDTFSPDEVLVIDAKKKNITPIGANKDLVSALVEANVVDVSSLSRLLSSRKLVVVEDKDLTILKALAKAKANDLFSPTSSAYVLPAEGVGNFRNLSQLGKVLKNLTGTKFALLFVQDRDGMPDFMVNKFLESQQADGVAPRLLERHEIESYLIEPNFFELAAKSIGRDLSAADATRAIMKAADTIKAKARSRALETAKLINKHLRVPDRFDESPLTEKVFEWFDALDLKSLETVQRVFPGKELLQETIKLINEKAEKHITRGLLISSISADSVAPYMCELLETVSKD